MKKKKRLHFSSVSIANFLLFIIALMVFPLLSYVSLAAATATLHNEQHKPTNISDDASAKNHQPSAGSLIKCTLNKRCVVGPIDCGGNHLNGHQYLAWPKAEEFEDDVVFDEINDKQLHHGFATDNSSKAEQKSAFSLRNRRSARAARDKQHDELKSRTSSDNMGEVWLKNGRYLEPYAKYGLTVESNTSSKQDSQQMLIIRSTNYSHVGRYHCVSAALHAVLLQVQLDVVQPAEFTEQPLSYRRPVGHEIRMRCVAHGSPIPQIRWLRNGETISPHDERKAANDKHQNKYRIVDAKLAKSRKVQSELIIAAADTSDSGAIFRCVASNEHGTKISGEAALTLFEGAAPAEPPHDILVRVVKHDSVDVSWQPPELLKLLELPTSRRPVIVAWTIHIFNANQVPTNLLQNMLVNTISNKTTTSNFSSFSLENAKEEENKYYHVSLPKQQLRGQPVVLDVIDDLKLKTARVTAMKSYTSTSIGDFSPFLAFRTPPAPPLPPVATKAMSNETRNGTLSAAAILQAARPAGAKPLGLTYVAQGKPVPPEYMHDWTLTADEQHAVAERKRSPKTTTHASADGEEKHGPVSAAKSVNTKTRRSQDEHVAQHDQHPVAVKSVVNSLTQQIDLKSAKVQEVEEEFHVSFTVILFLIAAICSVSVGLIFVIGAVIQTARSIVTQTAAAEAVAAAAAAAAMQQQQHSPHNPNNNGPRLSTSMTNNPNFRTLSTSSSVELSDTASRQALLMSVRTLGSESEISDLSPRNLPRPSSPITVSNIVMEAAADAIRAFLCARHRTEQQQQNCVEDENFRLATALRRSVNESNENNSGCRRDSSRKRVRFRSCQEETFKTDDEDESRGPRRGGAAQALAATTPSTALYSIAENDEEFEGADLTKPDSKRKKAKKSTKNSLFTVSANSPLLQQPVFLRSNSRMNGGGGGILKVRQAPGGLKSSPLLLYSTSTSTISAPLLVIEDSRIISHTSPDDTPPSSLLITSCH